VSSLKSGIKWWRALSGDVHYKWFSYQESTPVISRKTNIFAYDCAVHKFMIGRPLHYELATLDDRRRLAKRLYTENRLPEVIDLLFAELMQGCWHGIFNSMSEVLQALEATRMPITS
jgi:hypothetical protein